MNVDELNTEKEIKVKVRLDFKGTARPGPFGFGGKAVGRVAEEIREQQVAMFRNVPIQGIHIDDIDMSIDVYTVWDDLNKSDIAYAPVVLSVSAENMEDLLRFIARDDFRKIDVIAPASLLFTRYDMERFLFKAHEEIRGYISHLERKYNLR